MTFYLTSHPFELARRYAIRQRAMKMESAYRLPVDIREDEEGYTLTAFVPSIKADSLEIQVLEDTLNINGSFEKPEDRYLLSELPSGEFQRSLRFPLELDAEKTSAHIENGMLTLKVAKAESVRPRNIPVTVK